MRNNRGSEFGLAWLKGEGFERKGAGFTFHLDHWTRLIVGSVRSVFLLVVVVVLIFVCSFRFVGDIFGHVISTVPVPCMYSGHVSNYLHCLPFFFCHPH